MYTLGAALGVAVWCGLAGAWLQIANRRWQGMRSVTGELLSGGPFMPPQPWAGMYTVYYFVFLLIPLNLWVLWQIANGKWQTASRKSQPPASSPQLPASGFQLPAWLLANLATVLLYAPWIPVAFRQATNPPVPPWRTAPDLWHASGARAGPRQPGTVGAELALARTAVDAGVVWAGVVFAKSKPQTRARWRCPRHTGNRRPSSFVLRHSSVLPIATLGPLALILLVSLVTPLYHVRYLFTYSPAFYVVMAAGLAWWPRRSKVVFAVTLGVWLAAAGVTLYADLHDPAYRADDHRARGALRARTLAPR